MQTLIFLSAGPGNPLSATTGFPWVQEIASLFLRGPNTPLKDQGGSLMPPPLIMGFTVRYMHICHAALTDVLVRLRIARQ